MSNNNNKDHQQSPSKDPRKHYFQQQDRNYDQRRNPNNYYLPTASDHKQQMRNGGEYFNRMPSYPPPPHYYHPSFNSYPYAHPNPYANHIPTNPYNNHGRMPNHNPYNYSTYHQYSHQEMRLPQQGLPPNQQPTKPQQGLILNQERLQSDRNQLRFDDSKKKERDQQKEQEDRRERSFKRQSKRLQDDQSLSYRSQSSVSESEQEEVFYKRKVIAKRKDPVLDSKEEIRKWIQARRKNYPRKSLMPEAEEKTKTSQQEMSILQKKIRKKLVLINSDPRSIIKKQKDLDILRRFILYPRRQRRIIKAQKHPEGRPLIQEIDPEHINQPKKMKGLEESGPNYLKEVETAKVKQAEVGQIEEIPDTPRKRQSEDEDNEVAMEVPIRAGQSRRQQTEKRQTIGRGHKQLSVQVIINHLQMKQREDSKLLENLMDYKSNSCQYRYQYQTLETNLLLDNVFRDTSYMLQAIRYIVKHNFFQ